jgi:hypothetical protein
VLTLFGGDRRALEADDDATEIKLYVGALLIVELAANIRAIAHGLSKSK